MALGFLIRWQGDNFAKYLQTSGGIYKEWISFSTDIFSCCLFGKSKT